MKRNCEWNEEYVLRLLNDFKKQKGKCFLCGGTLFLGAGIVISTMFTCGKDSKMKPHMAHGGCCRGITHNKLEELYLKRHRDKLFELINKDLMKNKRKEFKGF